MTYLLLFLALHPLLAVLYIIWSRTGSMIVALPAFVIDVFLNYTTAALLWGWPRKGEYTISKRLKRPQTRNIHLAQKIVSALNRHDPGHV